MRTVLVPRGFHSEQHSHSAAIQKHQADFDGACSVVSTVVTVHVHRGFRTPFLTCVLTCVLCCADMCADVCAVLTCVLCCCADDAAGPYINKVRSAGPSNMTTFVYWIV
jgi:hypothetical protein